MAAKMVAKMASKSVAKMASKSVSLDTFCVMRFPV